MGGDNIPSQSSVHQGIICRRGSKHLVTCPGGRKESYFVLGDKFINN